MKQFITTAMIFLTLLAVNILHARENTVHVLFSEQVIENKIPIAWVEIGATAVDIIDLNIGLDISTTPFRNLSARIAFPIWEYKDENKFDFIFLAKSYHALDVSHVDILGTYTLVPRKNYTLSIIGGFRNSSRELEERTEHFGPVIGVSTEYQVTSALKLSGSVLLDLLLQNEVGSREIGVIRAEYSPFKNFMFTFQLSRETFPGVTMNSGHFGFGVFY